MGNKSALGFGCDCVHKLLSILYNSLPPHFVSFLILGILDQGEGVLIIFEEPPVDKTYEAALETIQNMSKVVDSLYNKAKKLT